MRGIASSKPAPRSTICRKNRTYPVFTTTLAFVEAGFSAEAADSRHWALYLVKELRLSGEEASAPLSGGEGRRPALAPARDILLLEEPHQPFRPAWKRVAGAQHLRRRGSRRATLSQPSDRFLDDGRICLSNNAAERALRGIANGALIVPLFLKCL